MRRCVDENGRSYSQITTGGKVYRYYDDAPVYPGDVWSDISHLQQKDPERTGYPTQKPLKLLERLLLPSCAKGTWWRICAAEAARRWKPRSRWAPLCRRGQEPGGDSDDSEPLGVQRPDD